jgi:cytoskeletal protein CcmA (bactofilin family)
MSSPKKALEQTASSVNDVKAEPLLILAQCFDKWCDEMHVVRTRQPTHESQSRDDNPSQIFIESLPGSNCDVTFEGVLHFDGHSTGNIRSPGGALVVTKRGIVDADIEVGIAVINGTVNGNIVATERVVLDSEAVVKGDIFTPHLSVKPGALFDGDCLPVNAEPYSLDEESSREQAEELEHLMVGV